MLAFLVSVPTLVTGSLDLYRAVRSTSWASVDGEIVSAGIETAPDVASSRGTGIHVDDTTAAAIRYRYVVDGKGYEGDTVRFGQVYSSSSLIGTAGETLKRHPIGPAKIYVAPDDPNLSVLEPGLTATAFLKPCVSLMFFGVGTWLLCSGIGVLRRN